MKTILETENLRLREFNTADATFIVRLLNSPGWLKFIGDRHVNTLEQAIDYLQNGPIKSYSTNGFGLWMVELKQDQTPVGMCGIIRRQNLENPDIGFAFLPEYAGRGLAFEIASATKAYAQNTLQLPVILAITIPSNSRSINLLQKIGLRLVKPFYMQGDDEELLLFST